MVNKGGIIAKGVNEELDDLRAIAYSGKDYLLKVQQREIELTGIPSLKIAFNNVFGYYIEVRNTHKDKVPANWIRKQTLVNAERYITEELKEYEEKILGAEEKILALETRLFNELVLALTEYIPPIQMNANLIGKEVKQKLAEYFKTHSFLQRRDFERLTGFNSSKSTRVIRILVKEGVLKNAGTKYQPVYVVGE